MACLRPRNVWRSSLEGPLRPRVDVDTGELLPGVSPISFSPVSGYDQLRISCGTCEGCRAARSMTWAIRAYHESTLHEQNCFVTLTYADNRTALDKSDLQKFFKRLRYHHSPGIRYLACGEYGDLTKRPHYHALLFGSDFLAGSFDIDGQQYSSPFLSSIWSHGIATVGSLSMGACCYVAGYVTKKINDPDTFNLCSRRPPIGHGWVAKYGSDIERTGSVTIEGREYPVPREYLEWDSARFAAVKRKRSEVFSSVPESKRRFVDSISAVASKSRNVLSRSSSKSKGESI